MYLTFGADPNVDGRPYSLLLSSPEPASNPTVRQVERRPIMMRIIEHVKAFSEGIQGRLLEQGQFVLGFRRLLTHASSLARTCSTCALPIR